MDVHANTGLPRTFHYAWVIAALTFIVLTTAGIRATPGILMVPLETEFAWNRTVISGAVAINIALYGLIGPFAASAIDRWGLRRIVAAALALLASSVALTTQMQSHWHLMLLWGGAPRAPRDALWACRAFGAAFYLLPPSS